MASLRFHRFATKAIASLGTEDYRELDSKDCTIHCGASTSADDHLEIIDSVPGKVSASCHRRLCQGDNA